MILSLNVKTEYSLLKSRLNILKMIEFAQKHDWTHLAIADTNNLHGGAELYFLCQKHNLIPIIGTEVDIDYATLGVHSLFFYALNSKGYKEISKIISQKNEGRDVIFTEIENSSNMAVLDSQKNGILAKLFLEKQRTEYQNVLELFLEKFKFFFNGFDRNSKIHKNDLVFEEFKNSLAQKNVQMFFHEEISYLNVDDFNAQNAMKAIRDMTIIKENVFSKNEKEHNLENKTDEIVKLEEWKNLKNFLPQFKEKIIHKNESTIKFEKIKGKNSFEVLKYLSINGLKEKLNGAAVPRIYYDRLVQELNVIKSVDFCDYFLIVWDFIKHAKQNKILIGPGRGSSPGSLVAYCLNITEIDPIKHGLIFERFLNNKRITMPDIDVDIEDERREEIIHYLFKQYGKKHVAHIITYQRIGVKLALRDIGRILEFPTTYIDWLSRTVTSDVNHSMKALLESKPQLEIEIQKSHKHKLLFYLADLIIGVPRQISTHAAGIVMSNEPLIVVVPTQINNQLTMTQYDMTYLENLGLFKIDILGIRNLSIIKKICVSIGKRSKKAFVLKNIEYDDPQTYKLFSEGLTTGIFQFESRGMKNLLKKVKPQNISDLALVNSLFRPGPKRSIDTFLKRKNKQEKITYPSLVIKNILKETLGIIIYQEQILQILQLFCKFDLNDADIVRRAITKKNHKMMNEIKKKFFDAAEKNERDKNESINIFNLIEEFANYGFNKSHALAYSMIGYQMAFLKIKFPIDFYCCLMNNNIGNATKTFEYLKEAKQFNIEFNGPNINLSDWQHTIVDSKIYFGMLSIQGIGNVTVQKIIDERDQNGKFGDYFMTVTRLIRSDISEKSIEAIIFSGGFDFLNLNRTEMTQNLRHAAVYASVIIIDYNNKKRIQKSLVKKPVFLEKKEDKMFNSSKELESLGLNIKNHPVEIIRKTLKINTVTIDEIIDSKQKFFKLFGVVTHIKKIVTKNNKNMAFVKFEDETNSIDLVVFPDKLFTYAQEIKENIMLLVNVKKDISKYNSVILENIEKGVKM